MDVYVSKGMSLSEEEWNSLAVGSSLVLYDPELAQEEAYEAIVVSVREAGLLLALPAGAVPAQTLAAGAEGDFPSTYGPSGEIETPGRGSRGGSIQAQVSVLLVDVDDSAAALLYREGMEGVTIRGFASRTGRRLVPHLDSLLENGRLWLSGQLGAEEAGAGRPRFSGYGVPTEEVPDDEDAFGAWGGWDGLPLGEDSPHPSVGRRWGPLGGGPPPKVTPRARAAELEASLGVQGQIAALRKVVTRLQQRLDSRDEEPPRGPARDAGPIGRGRGMLPLLGVGRSVGGAPPLPDWRRRRSD